MPDGLSSVEGARTMAILAADALPPLDAVHPAHPTRLLDAHHVARQALDAVLLLDALQLLVGVRVARLLVHGKGGSVAAAAAGVA